MPIFRSDATDFFVTLPNLNYGDPVASGNKKSDKKSDKKVSRPKAPLTLGKNAKIIMRVLAADGYATIPDLRRKTRLSHSGVYKILSALKAGMYIRRVGPDKGGHWEVLTTKWGDGE